MSYSIKPSEPESGDDSIGRWGCAILIAATILFALQRFFLFWVLAGYSEIGNAAAAQIHRFLYGEPPYSIFDTLLGFQIPGEGLFYILQPHNILLGFVQAIHFGVNFGFAYGLFWLFDRFRLTTADRPLLRYSGCLGCFVLIVLAALAAITFVGSTPLSSTPSQTQGDPGADEPRSYSNTQAGVSFEFPSFMELQTDNQKERGPSGQLVKLITLSATSRDPVVAILIRIIEDPLRDQMFPNLYPPSDQSLRTLILGEITNLDYEKTDVNRSAINASSDNAVIKPISGFRAATYKVSLEGTSFGHVYVRGALIVTNRRDVSLYIIGSDEPGVTGSVTPEYIDGLWSKLLASFSLDY